MIRDQLNTFAAGAVDLSKVLIQFACQKHTGIEGGMVLL